MAEPTPPHQSDSLNPFCTLQKNASDLFDGILARNSTQMACQTGCSKCCHAEFSIFSGEAWLIDRWFQRLTPEQQAELHALWQSPAPTKACRFLRHDQCTIYEARPIICRTQGAPLRFSIEKKDAVTQTIDCCPLNFDGGKAIPKAPAEWFDLDRLTSLQAIAENYVQKNFEISAELKALCDKNDRIPLGALQSFLSAKVTDK